MINQPPPFHCLNIRIPIIIPIKGRGCINQGSGLSKLSFAKLCLGCLEFREFRCRVYSIRVLGFGAFGV